MSAKLEITIDNVRPSDAVEAATLSAELGYPVTAGVMARRLNHLSTLSSHAVIGAYVQARLVGWVDVSIAFHLQYEPYGEIGGLVVSGKYQGCGIGRALVEAAEKWIASQNIEKVLVRSQIAREGAHAFYLRQNYSRTKTSAVFTKSITSP